jgi:hypothetical protein
MPEPVAEPVPAAAGRARRRRGTLTPPRHDPQDTRRYRSARARVTPCAAAYLQGADEQVPFYERRSTGGTGRRARGHAVGGSPARTGDPGAGLMLRGRNEGARPAPVSVPRSGTRETMGRGRTRL